jgi:hypothetical protein
MAAGHNDTAIFIEGTATDVLYLNPVPTPETSPVPPGSDPFGIIYVSSGDALSPNAGDPYYRKPGDGQAYDLLQAAVIAQATFITVVNEPALPDSRLLAVTGDLKLTDGGAQGSITIGLSDANSAALAAVIGGSFVTVLHEPGLAQSRQIAVSSDLKLTDGGAQNSITIGLSTANSAFLAGARTASFVTVLHEGGLPQSRQLNGVSGLYGGIFVQDQGAGSTVDVGIDSTLTTNLGNLLTGPFLFPTNQAATFPQSRQVIAGPGITLFDGGAGGSFAITAEASVVVGIQFLVTPVSIAEPPYVVAQAWSFTKVGKRVTVIFDTFAGLDGGTAGISSVVAPVASIPAAYAPAIGVQIVAAFLGLTSLVFSSTWAILSNGSVEAAGIPTPISQFLLGPGHGWVATSLTWNTA